MTRTAAGARKFELIWRRMISSACTMRHCRKAARAPRSRRPSRNAAPRSNLFIMRVAGDGNEGAVVPALFSMVRVDRVQQDTCKSQGMLRHNTRNNRSANTHRLCISAIRTIRQVDAGPPFPRWRGKPPRGRYEFLTPASLDRRHLLHLLLSQAPGHACMQHVHHFGPMAYGASLHTASCGTHHQRRNQCGMRRVGWPFRAALASPGPLVGSQTTRTTGSTATQRQPPTGVCARVQGGRGDVLKRSRATRARRSCGTAAGTRRTWPSCRPAPPPGRAPRRTASCSRQCRGTLRCR